MFSYLQPLYTWGLLRSATIPPAAIGIRIDACTALGGSYRRRAARGGELPHGMPHVELHRFPTDVAMLHACAY